MRTNYATVSSPVVKNAYFGCIQFSLKNMTYFTEVISTESITTPKGAMA